MRLGLHGEIREERTRQKPGSLAASLMLHVSVFYALMNAPTVRLPPPSPSEYAQAIKGNEERIVWYRLPDKLPKINSEAPRKEKRALRAENKAKQSIVSSPLNAPKASQMVWNDAPAIEAQPLESANLLAVMERLLPPRPFTAPPDIVRSPAPEVSVPEAPAITSNSLPAAAPAVKLPAKAFVAPELKARQQRSVDVPLDSPEIAPSHDPRQSMLAVKLPPRPFAAPRGAASIPERAAVEPAEAPQIAAAALPAGGTPAGKLPSRPFSAPARTPAKLREVDIGAPPAIGNSSDLNVAVVGLNPANTVNLPSFSNPAAFSGGETVRPDGATSDGATKGLTVPNLFARTTDPETARRSGSGQPSLISRAYAAPTAPETLREALRSAKPVAATTVMPAPRGAAASNSTTPSGATAPSTATRVSGAPTSRFDGRDVYLMAIQMPNLTSFSGSWLMWYADKSTHASGLTPISAPVAHRKVDPKYFADAVAERREGTVQLFCVIGKDGTVSGIETLKGFDARLDQSAREALAKWEFYPAMRQDEAVEVEVVVEIPFRLAPRDPAKR